VGFRNAAVTVERALGLVPEVLDSIDVIVAIENVGVRVVDPVVMELGDVDLPLDDRKEGVLADIRDPSRW
jgi:hypothetical protein